MAAHRKKVRRFHEPGDFHESTFSCYRRLQLLTRDDWQTWLAERIDMAMIAHECRLVAYVFMPEHVHLLLFPTRGDANVGAILKSVKTPFSSRARRHLEQADDPLLSTLTVQERPGVTCFRCWQEGGGYDRNLRSQKAVLAAIDYIHENPVRRGLSEQAWNWRWSSARHYREEHAAQCACGPPKIHGVPWDFFDPIPPCGMAL